MWGVVRISDGCVKNYQIIRGSARLSKLRSSANKVQQNFNAFWKVLSLENSAWDFFGGNFSGPGIFLDVVESPRDFFWGWI